MRLIDADLITDSDIIFYLGKRYASCAPDIRDMINDAPTVQQWIPVEERLPEVMQDCIVNVRYSGFMGMYGIWIKTGHLERNNSWWGDCVGGEVTAWMPLPIPYNVAK